MSAPLTSSLLPPPSSLLIFLWRLPAHQVAARTTVATLPTRHCPDRVVVQPDIHASLMADSFPHVVACGPKQIFIPKSGLRFPAWLVAIDTGQRVWRSKRDFWRLHRVSRREANIDLPQSAWKKLADRASWTRPGSSSSGDNQGCENRWDPSMKKSLRLVDVYLQSVKKATGDKTTSAQLVEAWSVFARDEDTEMEPDDGKDDLKGSSLGQYFCSEENAELLVRSLRSYLPTDLENVAIIEPSCGHGQILRSIEQQISPQRLLGFDLDGDAIMHCTRQFPSAKFHSGDFLKTQRREHIPEDVAVFFAGGPPYSAGQGSGDCMQRDIPVKFVQHAVNEWKASVVVFLMPERCRHIYFSLPGDYTLETNYLDAGSHFFFRDQIRVTQPSVLMIFRKV